LKEPNEAGAFAMKKLTSLQATIALTSAAAATDGSTAPSLHPGLRNAASA